MKKKIRSSSLMERNKKSFSGTFRAPKKTFNFFYLILIAIFFLLISFIIFIFSGFFNIKHWELSELKDLNKSDIELIIEKQIGERNFIFPQKNILFFSKNKLSNSLSSYNFSRIDIKKKVWSRVLIVSPEERKISLIFKENNKYFFIDREANIVNIFLDCQTLEELGSINELEKSLDENIEALAGDSVKIEEEDDEYDPEDDFFTKDKPYNCLDSSENFKNKELLPLIENFGENRFSEGKKTLKISDDYLDFSLRIYNDLSEGGDFAFKSIILDEEYNTIKVRLENDLELYFNLKDDYSEQISRFLILKKERLNDLKHRKYIDLRYGDKIFYY